VLIDEQRFAEESPDEDRVREQGIFKIVEKQKRTELNMFEDDEPPVQDLSRPSGKRHNKQSRLHEHSPVRTPTSESNKVPNRVLLPPELIREGNRIIEQIYVDEIIKAIDEVVFLSADKIAVVIA
jgi:hypothetical protein